MSKSKQSKKDGKQEPVKGNGKPTNFADLKKQVESASDEKITSCMDRLLLKGGTFDELVGQIAKDNDRLKSKDFRTPSRVKSHIKSREQAGWVFTLKDDSVKLTGFEKRQ